MNEEKKPECFGRFLDEATSRCESWCDKEEQRECFEEWKKKDESKRKVEQCKLPWYKQENAKILPEGACDTCG